MSLVLVSCHAHTHHILLSFFANCVRLTSSGDAHLAALFSMSSRLAQVCPTLQIATLPLIRSSVCGCPSSCRASTLTMTPISKRFRVLQYPVLRTLFPPRCNLAFVQDLTKKKFNSHETGASSSAPANALVLATPDHRDSLRALYIWRDCAARVFDCGPRFVYWVAGCGYGKVIHLAQLSYTAASADFACEFIFIRVA